MSPARMFAHCGRDGYAFCNDQRDGVNGYGDGVLARKRHGGVGGVGYGNGEGGFGGHGCDGRTDG